MTRKTKIALWALVALVVAALAWRWMVFDSYYSRVKEELKFLRAEGGSEDILDLVPKPLGKRDSGSVKLLKSDLLKAPYSPQAVAQARFKDPAVPDDTKVGAAYQQFGNWLWQFGPTWVRSGAPVDWKDAWVPWLRRLLDRNKTVLDAARAAMADDQVMFDTDWSQGYSASAAHLGALRETVQLLCLDAVLKSRDGDMKGAFESITTGFRLRRLIDREPSIVSRFSAMICDNIALGGLAAVLEHGHAGRSDVEAILAELAGREDRNRMTDAFLGETARGCQLFRMGRRDPMGTLESIRSYGSGVGPSSKEGPMTSFFLGLGIKVVWNWPADELNYLQIMRELRANSRLDFPAALAPAPTLSQLLSQPPASSSGTMMLAPPFYRCLAQTAGCDARIRLARTALALYLYRTDNGSYPSSLDALAPKYLPAVEMDPFDGKPLRYMPSANGFVIYSIGEDMKQSEGASLGAIVWEHEDATPVPKE